MNTLYDIFLGAPDALHGYRCNSFVRDSAPLIASRFSTGQRGPSDLDLLQVDGFSALAGGMFQRTHDNSQKVSRLLGIYNSFDNNVYSPPVRITSGTTPTQGIIYGKAESPTVTFISHSYSAGTNANYLYQYSAGSTSPTAITLPTPYTLPATGFISGLCLHGDNFLFVSGCVPGVTSVNAYSYNLTTGIWQDLNGVLFGFCELLGALYGVGSDGTMYAVTNEFAAGPATFTRIAYLGSSANLYQDMVEFNGAIYIAKTDGIYRFNGTATAPRVLSIVTSKLQVWNGALYFFSGKWLYKFDGVTVSKVQFFDETFIGFTATSDFLYISFSQSLGTQTYDRYGSVTSSDIARHVYLFDGVGFSLLDEVVYVGATATANFSNLWSVGTYVFDMHDIISNRHLYVYKMNTLYSASAVTTSSHLEITSSEFDADFPAIYKSFESLDLDYTGFTAGDSIAVSYQTYNGSAWSSWQSLGTITSSSVSTLDLVDASKKLFKRLKILLIVTFAAGSTLSIKGGSWHYTLQPRQRWRWQAGLLAYGSQGDLRDRNNAVVADDANALTNFITASIKQKTPSYMLGPDYGLIKTGVNAAAVAFIVRGQLPLYTDPYAEWPLIAVKNHNGVWELLRCSGVTYSSGSDETTITVLERGYLGITAAAIDANAEFHLAYKVFVTRLLRDATIISELTTHEQSTTGESQLSREFLIEITEA